MSDLPIGSLWRSRHNADIRLITEFEGNVFGNGDAFMVCYHDVTRGYTATTISCAGEWAYDWKLLSA